ncbi:hypothetical protein GOP47_0004821 [Adiantum capillus-veneris]|uniref:Uncharacterized protein n=1 Tax=Adiantum capillus-veneris TaxID=13818 RepID=A0A9D4ZMM2_ADICA|nr:hypothetical protein GOP47_0004821 [Adiantum capillus-veneris]
MIRKLYNMKASSSMMHDARPQVQHKAVTSTAEEDWMRRPSSSSSSSSSSSKPPLPSPPPSTPPPTTTSRSNPHLPPVIIPASKPPATCLCSPTSHPGSFRCRLHRSTPTAWHHPPSPRHHPPDAPATPPPLLRWNSSGGSHLNHAHPPSILTH